MKYYVEKVEREGDQTGKVIVPLIIAAQLLPKGKTITYRLFFFFAWVLIYRS